ncbi:MAG: HD domain-containing protein [Planctomycetota bacterium]|nr:HD domain-containing protein [Planctomycetota bacterium]MDA1252367.1 HD domain-containing protein [Planctomycetota bacterium]
MSTAVPAVRFFEMAPGQLSDTFAMLASKDEARTRDDKPYYRVSFKDAKRTATAMIWADNAFFEACRDSWQVGSFYKLRCRFEESSYGPQIDIDRLREAIDTDREAGFDPDSFFATSRYDRDEMFAELLSLVEEHVDAEPVKRLVLEMLDENAEGIRQHAAAVRNHHAFMGGYLEHTLSVVKTAIFLADKYSAYYTEMTPPLSKSLVVAGAVLHDIGKMEELAFKPGGWEYTPRGRLVGHILIGRDMMLKKAGEIPELDEETVLRLEHMIVSHQGIPEWGSPVPPSTPEAMLVHYADDLDAKFHELAVQLENSQPLGAEFTDNRNPLRRRIFLGLKSKDADLAEVGPGDDESET